MRYQDFFGTKCGSLNCKFSKGGICMPMKTYNCTTWEPPKTTREFNKILHDSDSCKICEVETDRTFLTACCDRWVCEHCVTDPSGWICRECYSIYLNNIGEAE